MRPEIEKFISTLLSDPKVTANSSLGCCRMWTREACRLAREHFNSQLWEVMAVEVDNIGGVDHTFLRIRHQQQPDQSFLFDGTGVGKFDPYFGFEADAPLHLRNSHLDSFHTYF